MLKQRKHSLWPTPLSFRKVVNELDEPVKLSGVSKSKLGQSTATLPLDAVEVSSKIGKIDFSGRLID
jgi:hypothetical protein